MSQLVPNPKASPTADDSTGSAALRRNDRAYRWLVSSIEDGAGRDVESRLEWVRAAADFATYHHTGRFADGAIENVAFGIGARLDELLARRGGLGPWTQPALPPADGRPHVVHVMTWLEAIGGGPRVVARWIAADPGSMHSIIVTNQVCGEIPKWVADVVAANGGGILALPRHAPLLDKAKLLREAVRSKVDFIFLHHHCDDVVPTVALARPGGAPVAVSNDADHMFWLGSSVADAILNWRTIGRDVSRERRFMRHNLMIPLPLEDTRLVPRPEARRLLGIPDDQVVVLSTGRAAKYRPDGRRNFFRAAARIVEQNPSAHLYVVGVWPAEAARHLPAGSKPNERRLHFLGPVKEPLPYAQAADVYLEGFPFGSQTALLEAAVAGVAIVPACDPPCRLLVTDDDPINDLLVSPADEDEYVGRATALIQDSQGRLRLGETLRRRLLASHTGRGWNAGLQAVYADFASLRHEPGPIEVAPSLETETDLALSRWYADVTAGSRSSVKSADDLSAVAFDVAHRLRTRGFFRDAYRLLRIAARHRSCRKPPLMLAMAKLPLHWARHQVRSRGLEAGRQRNQGRIQGAGARVVPA